MYKNMIVSRLGDLLVFQPEGASTADLTVDLQPNYLYTEDRVDQFYPRAKTPHPWWLSVVNWVCITRESPQLAAALRGERVKPDPIVVVHMRLDANEVVHSRSVYSLLGFLGDVGGFHFAVTLIFFNLLGWYQNM